MTAAASAMAAQPLFLRTWGDGPPVLFLHGIGGSSRYWQPLAAASGGYRGTAVDLLGFGRSPRPDEASYDVECHLHALLPLVAPGSLVVAHSTGAVLAAALAVRHPHLVRGLLLIGAPLYRDQADARQQVRRLGLLARVTVSGHLAGPLTMLLLHSLVRPFSGRLPLDLPEPVVQDFWEHSWTSYSRTLRRVVAGHPAVPDLRRLPVPGTLVYGADDRSAARRDVHQLVRDRTSLRYVEVPGDHHVAVRAPDRIAPLLEARLPRA